MAALTTRPAGAHVIERAARAVHMAMDQPMPKFVRQSWEQLTPPARRAMLLRAIGAIRALRYEDGTDEDLAIIVGARLRLDPVMVIECFDGMLAAILGPLNLPESEYHRNRESE